MVTKKQTLEGTTCYKLCGKTSVKLYQLSWDSEKVGRSYSTNINICIISISSSGEPTFKTVKVTDKVHTSYHIEGSLSTVANKLMYLFWSDCYYSEKFNTPEKRNILLDLYTLSDISCVRLEDNIYVPNDPSEFFNLVIDRTEEVYILARIYSFLSLQEAEKLETAKLKNKIDYDPKVNMQTRSDALCAKKNYRKSPEKGRSECEQKYPDYS